jgi:putative ABC transport system permease protein
MWLNLVQAVRHLRRRPVLAAVGILSLAVGIGCALASASVVNAVLFRAFPYPEPDRLVLVWENNAKRGVGLTPTSILNYKDLKAAATSFDELGAFADTPFSIDGPDGSERAIGYRATAGLLDHTQVSPLLGRLFTAEEDKVGGADVVVLSHGLWQRRFGADPSVIGQTVRLTGVPFTIVGVMPRGFVLPPVFSAHLINADHVIKEADFWIPMKIDGFPQRREARFLFVLGRLKAGHSIEQGQAEASNIAARLATDYSVDDFGMDFTVVPLDEQVLSSVQTLLVLLLVVGVLVLVIAVTNAAHLLLADSLTKTGETAVRAALGATTWRLASGQGTLSLLWCGLGTIGALVIAAAIQTPVAAYTKANVPRLSEVTVDGTVGSLALLLGGVLALVITLLPLVYARRVGTERSAASTPAPVGMPRWRRLFVILQLAMAIVVLSTAALLFRSADALASVHPGLVAEGVSVFELMLPPSRYGSPARRVEFEGRLLGEVAGVAGAQAVAVVDHLPFEGNTSIVNITVEHQVVTDATARPRAALRAVSASYFDVLSIPSVEGRAFVPTDEGAATSVAIVNDAFVQRFLRGETVIGRRIKRGELNSPMPWMTIVGVAGSARSAGLGLDAEPELFIPYVKDGVRTTVNLIVKANVPPAVLTPAVVARIHRADAALSPTTVTAMTELIARAVGQPYFYARLFGVLAAVAFFLSLAGVYSVAVLGVSARSNEIAIRSCRGAQRLDIVGLILRETGIAVSIAVGVGSIGAVILQQRMAAFVYGAGSTDWTVIAASALLLSVLALGTVYIAIRRVLVLRPLDLLKQGAGALA